MRLMVFRGGLILAGGYHVAGKINLVKARLAIIDNGDAFFLMAQFPCRIEFNFDFSGFPRADGFGRGL